MSEKDAIDWKDIFVKYVAVVVRQEGVTFLDGEGCYHGEWTPEEWRAIESVDADIDARLERLEEKMLHAQREYEESLKKA